MKPEPIEVRAEASFSAGHAEIGDQRKTEPTAHGGALHRSDDRLPGAEEADRLFVEVPAGAATASLLDRPGLHALRESAPAQNDRPSAASTIARHPGSPSSRSNASPISAISSLSKKLCGGRRISTVATKAVLADPDVAHSGSTSGFPFDEQGIDHGEALSLRVDDDRVEVDFLDQIRVVGGEAGECRHQLGQGRSVSGRHASHPVE